MHLSCILTNEQEEEVHDSEKEMEIEEETKHPKKRTRTSRICNEMNCSNLVVSRKNDERIAKAQHGLQRALLNNAVTGVVKGFSKQLEVNGVGFRVSGGGSKLELALGLSHPVIYNAKEGVVLTVDKMTITVTGIDKQKVGQTAAEIRSLKKPEPYKGKGIKYVDEVLLRKAGKAGK